MRLIHPSDVGLNYHEATVFLTHRMQGMAVPQAVNFHSRPKGVAWTGAAVLVGSVVLAIAVLATL
jgi:hypothetical protein